MSLSACCTTKDTNDKKREPIKMKKTRLNLLDDTDTLPILTTDLASVIDRFGSKKYDQSNTISQSLIRRRHYAVVR